MRMCLRRHGSSFGGACAFRAGNKPGNVVVTPFPGVSCDADAVAGMGNRLRPHQVRGFVDPLPFSLRNVQSVWENLGCGVGSLTDKYWKVEREDHDFSLHCSNENWASCRKTLCRISSGITSQFWRINLRRGSETE